MKLSGKFGAKVAVLQAFSLSACAIVMWLIPVISSGTEDRFFWLRLGFYMTLAAIISGVYVLRADLPGKLKIAVVATVGVPLVMMIIWFVIPILFFHINRVTG